MSTNSNFTVTEFIELLVCSVLGGFLTGGLIFCLYIRSKKRNHLRHTQVQKEANGAWVLDIAPRQSASIPIQDPPIGGNRSALTRNLSFSVRVAVGTSHDGRHHDSIIHDDSNSWAPAPTTPHSPSHRSSLPHGNARHSRFNRSTRPSIRKEVNTQEESVGNSTSELEPLSRTTTAVSTLPPYDNLSIGPPRYPTSGTSLSDVPTGSETTGPVEPLPPLPRLQQGLYGNVL